MELAVKSAVDDVNIVSNFRLFVDSLYKVYSMSPKNQRGLEAAARQTNVHLLKVQKVFDVRWVFSSFISVKALLRDFEALHVHFKHAASVMSRTSTERSKYQGLLTKMKAWLFVAEAAMLKDALRELKNLSLYFQRDSASVVDAMTQIKVAQDRLLALKETEGKSLKKVVSEFKATSKFRRVDICTNDNDQVKFNNLKLQFHQSLIDNICRRFPATTLLQAAEVLNPQSWPTDVVQLALFGDTEISQLSKSLGFSSIDIADIIFEYSTFKKGCAAGQKLKKLMNLLSVYPISSAVCERGFSQMNLQQTSLRNSLCVETLSSLLMISVNGPPLVHWNPRRYVLSWLQAGHRSALDKITGVARKPHECTLSQKLFL